MDFSSIEQIKKEFNLKSDGIDNIREELNKTRIELHPDKTNGTFKDESDKTKYHKINDAISFIDNLKSNNQIIVVEKITDLIKVFTEYLPINKVSTLENKVESKINFAIQNYKSKFYLPKLSLTTITGILTFIVAFPGQIKDNPFLSLYIDPKNTIFVIIWIYLLINTGFAWLLAYSHEEFRKEKLSLLKVDSTQNIIFESFIKSLNKDYFTKDELTIYIYEKNIKKGILSRLFGEVIVSLEIAQTISELIIAKAEKKLFIENIVDKSLSETYKIKNYA